MKHIYSLLLIFTLVCTIKSQPFTDALSASPNPFYDRTQLNYSFSYNDTVTISVMNELGQTILTLFTNSVMPAGNYQDSLILNTGPNQGIYFVSMKLGHRKNMAAKIIKTGPLALVDISANADLRVYPNPHSGMFFVETKAGVALLGIYSALGELVYTFKEPSFSGYVDMKGFASGHYVIRYQYASTMKHIKLVKE